jgi:hypothetical protein
MLPAVGITSLSSEARKFRVSEGVERHPIAQRSLWRAWREAAKLYPRIASAIVNSWQSQSS